MFGDDIRHTPLGDIDLERVMKRYELTIEEIQFAKEMWSRGEHRDEPNPFLEDIPITDEVPEHMRTPLARAKWRKNTLTAKMRQERDRLGKQQKFLDMMRQGVYVKDAIESIGVVRQTIDNWRARYPDFAADFDEAKKTGSVTRSSVKDTVRSGYIRDLTFEQKRKYLFGRDTYWWQSRMIQIIEDAPHGEVTMILLPPGSGKTLTIEDYLKIDIGEYPDNRTLYISETDDLPKKVIQGFKEAMTDPELYPNYMMAFGPFKQEDLETSKEHKKWSELAIKVAKATGTRRDYTLVAKGWRTHITNIRADTIICDDMQTISTLHLTDKLLSYIRNSFLNRREGLTKGKFIIIGHRLGMNDIYQAMIDEELVAEENIFILPLTDDETPDKSNFEPLFSSEHLPLIRRQQGSMFDTIMQQNPIKSMLNTFRDALSEFWDEDWKITDPFDFFENYETVTCVDPSLVGGNCVMTMSYDDQNIRLREMDYEFNLTKPKLIENKIEKQVLRYGSPVVIIESKAFQQALVTSESMEAMAKRYGFTIIPHDTGHNKRDEVMGVPQMEYLMSHGGIKAPGADARSKEMFIKLYEQLERWRPDVKTKNLIQDCVMTLWFGWYYIVQRRRTGEPLGTGLHAKGLHKNIHENTDSTSSYALPWQPTQYEYVSTTWSQ